MVPPSKREVVITAVVVILVVVVSLYYPFFFANPPTFEEMIGVSTGAGSVSTATPSEPQPPDIPTPVEDGTVIEQTFRITDGPAAPSSFRYPVRVEFQRVMDMNWTAMHVLHVDRLEPFTVELIAGERYRIAVEDMSGEHRVIGLFVSGMPGYEDTIRVYACCVDDFSGDG